MTTEVENLQHRLSEAENKAWLYWFGGILLGFTVVGFVRGYKLFREGTAYNNMAKYYLSQLNNTE